MSSENISQRATSYDYDELLAIGRGEVFGIENAKLPLPNMLMFDRILTVDENGGNFGNGIVSAELDIKEDLWFFGCHFPADPVMPGCLGLDAMWQLLGFYLVWTGLKGKGRALGVGEVRFRGQIRPTDSKVKYSIHIKRIVDRKVVLGYADGVTSVDGREIYFAKDLRVGLFTSLEEF